MQFVDFSTDLTDWEKLLHFSRPHDQFRLDWSSYGAIDFGNTFLPYVNKIESDGITIYDGAECFSKSDDGDNNLLKLDDRSVLELVLYTYPKGADIGQNFSKVLPKPQEICVFMELNEMDKIQFRFAWGNDFNKFLKGYFDEKQKKTDITGLMRSVYETDKEAIADFFKNSSNHQTFLLFLLPYLGVEINSATDDGEIQIKLIKEFNSMVPFGVKRYYKDPQEAQNAPLENNSARFEIQVREKGIDQFQFEIFNGEDVYASFPLGSGLLDSNRNPVSIGQSLAIGTYFFEWDGFDNNDIYDSVELVKREFMLRMNTENNGVSKSTDSKQFNFKYEEVNWIDVKIDRNTKRADFHMRVELEDGGEKGTQVDCNNAGNCPWDDVTPEALANEGKPIIKNRSQSYTDLRDAALIGIGKFWGRNSTNIGSDVTVDNDSYEVYVTAEASDKGLKAPKIIYVTNKNKELRSRNFFLSRILFYNVGYFYDSNWQNYANYHLFRNPTEAKRRFDNKGWYYLDEDIADFEMTSAHEIGHEILKAYGGANYSFSHKDTSTVLTQNPLNNPRPSSGELDLMQYYNEYYIISRTVAAEADVLGFFWLTKLKVK